MINGDLTTTEAEAVARRAFEANRKTRSALELSTFEFTFDEASSAFSLRVVGRLDTAIMGVVGQEFTSVNILTEATVAPPRVLEAVLVLDATDSMAGTKLTSLKSAANDLVDTLMKDTDNTTKVGIVPFSNPINIGLSREDAPWLNVPDSYTENRCVDTFPNQTSCRRVTETCEDDGESYSCERTVCDDLGEPVQVCSDRTFEWRGCVGSRNAPLNVEDRDYDFANRVPGLLNV